MFFTNLGILWTIYICESLDAAVIIISNCLTEYMQLCYFTNMLQCTGSLELKKIMGTNTMTSVLYEIVLLSRQ